MKKSHKYILALFSLTFICSLPALAVAPIPPEPPPPSPYSYPYTYNLNWGYYVSGYTHYMHHDNGYTLDFRAFAYFWVVSFSFYLEVYFPFTAAQCSELYLDYTDNSLWANGFVNLYAYYSTGSNQFLGSFHRGYHTIQLDSSRSLVKIGFLWSETSGWFWWRYVYIDYLVAKKV